MSFRTLALILGLAAVTSLLLYIALIQKPSSMPQYSQNTTVTQIPTQAPVNVHTSLSFSPNPLMALAGTSTTLDVLIDSQDNDVTAVQLELSYDPKAITILSVGQPVDPFIKSPFPLLNQIDAKNGRVSYAVGVAPKVQSPKGVGKVATITLQSKLASGEQTTIQFLPKSLVTAEKVQNSVLKSTTGVTIIGKASTTVAPVTTSPTQ